VGILFCEMPCVVWDHTTRICVSSFPAIRAGGSYVQKGGPLCSCTAEASTYIYISQKIFLLNFVVDNTRILQARPIVYCMVWCSETFSKILTMFKCP
jgi:hypothetical protein